MANKKPARRLSFKNKLILPGVLIGIALSLLFNFTIKKTSTDSFCSSCHSHPHVTESWKLSTHYFNRSGIKVHCVQCHLPPGGVSYYTEKARMGIKDAWGELFKDAEKIDWDEKSRLNHAVTYTYDGSCIKCHAELFSKELSEKGTDAHVYYFTKKEEVRCINCHLHVGHFSDIAETDTVQAEGRAPISSNLPDRSEVSNSFISYAEKLPGSEVFFEMIAIPGGSYTMGSPASEKFRKDDEGPVHEVIVSPFWMGRVEVSWRQYDVFLKQTGSMFKSITAHDRQDVDAITGPTPPYGTPDQGWGKGDRPAITMTHHAAEKYCEWLSARTGDTYRLPTEAEWEYASRGGSADPYFFPGDPGKYSKHGFMKSIFGVDTSTIARYVWYEQNAGGRTNPPNFKKQNPYGLENMAGNVKEFCLDWYAPDTYSKRSSAASIIDPTGPIGGKEHVIRGGSYSSDAADLRSAARDKTRHAAWMVTDPQSPKSVWWYSDCFDVGFRVLRETRKK